jgi:tetratricopeptide (TPR) repeat protein
MLDGSFRGAQQFLDELAALGEGATGKPYLVQLFAAAACGLGDYGRAERMCRELIERGYGADNYVRLGRILQEQGRLEEALDAYARGLAGIGLAEEDVASEAFPFACPMDYDAFSATVGRGECLLALGRRDEAARALRRACRLRANSPRPYVAFGRLLLQEGGLDQAAEAFGLAARQERPARDVQVEGGMAEVCERRGDPAGAFEWCRRGLARCPDDETLMEAAGRLGERIGCDEELARLYRAFLCHRPGHVGALTSLAALLRSLGRESEARELSERAAVLRSAG